MVFESSFIVRKGGFDFGSETAQPNFFPFMFNIRIPVGFFRAKTYPFILRRSIFCFASVALVLRIGG